MSSGACAYQPFTERTLRSTLAGVTAQICEGDYAGDLDFDWVNVKGDSPSLEVVQEKLSVL